MNAVWLNDKLMVRSGHVVGLEMEEAGVSADVPNTLSVHVYVLLSSSHRRWVWGTHWRVLAIGEEGRDADVLAGWAELRRTAEAEMARLSELLWPSQPPDPLPPEHGECGSNHLVRVDGREYVWRCRNRSGHDLPHVLEP